MDEDGWATVCKYLAGWLLGGCVTGVVPGGAVYRWALGGGRGGKWAV